MPSSDAFCDHFIASMTSPDQPICGVTRTATHWLRAIQAYGPLPGPFFLVQTWHPLSAPRPTRRLP